MEDLKKLLQEAKARMLVFPFEPCLMGKERYEGEWHDTHNEETCSTCKSRRAWEALQRAINGRP